MSATPWDSLEIAKLAIEFLTPLAVIGIGWFINHRLKQIELIQWSNQKIIEKRLELYDCLSPLLNRLLCFYTWIGYWREVSPKQVIETKRELDKQVYIYKHLLGDSFFAGYQKYMALLFKTYTGPGEYPKILSFIEGPNGDRRIHSKYKWKTEWDHLFICNELDYNKQKKVIANQHELMMNEFKKSIGL
jgi:hypothetical protein